GPLTGLPVGHPQRLQAAPSCSDALPFLPTCLSHPASEPAVELDERCGRIGKRKVSRPPHREAVDLSDPPLHRDTPSATGQTAYLVLGPLASLGVQTHLDLAATAVETEPQQGLPNRPVNRRLPVVDLQLEAILDINADALKDTMCRALAPDINPAVVGVAHETVSASIKLPVEVVEHDVTEQRRERGTLRGPILARVHTTVSHNARVQVTPNQTEHLLILHTPCDPRHQSVVVDPIKERVQIHLDAPPR